MTEAMVTAMLIQSAPYSVASLIGIGVALSRRARHPRLSALVIVILVARFALMAGSFAFSHWVYSSIDAGADPEGLGFYSGLVNVFVSILNGAVWLALIAAVFMGRDSGEHKASASPAAA